MPESVKRRGSSGPTSGAMPGCESPARSRGAFAMPRRIVVGAGSTLTERPVSLRSRERRIAMRRSRWWIAARCRAWRSACPGVERRAAAFPGQNGKIACPWTSGDHLSTIEPGRLDRTRNRTDTSYARRTLDPGLVARRRADRYQTGHPAAFRDVDIKNRRHVRPPGSRFRRAARTSAHRGRRTAPASRSSTQHRNGGHEIYVMNGTAVGVTRLTHESLESLGRRLRSRLVAGRGRDRLHRRRRR